MGLKINGSTSGSIEIDVPAVAGTDTSITIPATSGGEFIVSDSAGDVNLDSGTFFVDASTNRCGIGTTSPSANLHVQVAGDEAIRASATGANQGIWSRYLAGSPHGVDLYVGSDGAAGGSFGVSGAVVWNAGNTSLSFGTNNTERMTVASDGRLTINTASQATQMKRNNAASGSAIIEFQNSSGTVAWMRLDGGLANVQSNDLNLSDEREKKNIINLDSTWDCLKHWELKKFHYNEDADDADLRYGVIAQQIALHCPEVIDDWVKQQAADAVLDEDGNEVEAAQEEIVRMGVKEQQMMWMAIKALQEAQTRIETLETANASLEARLTALEGGAS